MHAGLWRQVSEASVRRSITVLKVKAHREESAVIGAGDRGNEATDGWAKHVASEAAFKELEVIKEKERLVLIRFARKYVLKALEAFYREEQEVFLKVRNKAVKSTNTESPGHWKSWAWQ